MQKINNKQGIMGAKGKKRYAFNFFKEKAIVLLRKIKNQPLFPDFKKVRRLF